MNGFPRPLAQAAGAVLALLLVAGCGTSPTTAYFSLEPAMPAAAPQADYRGPAVQVLAVHLPPALDRLELMRETRPGQLDVNEFARWAAPLARMARQTLTEDLVNRLPPGAVVFPDAHKPDGAALVSVDILSFRTSGATVQADVSWGLRGGLPSDPAWRTRVLRLTAPAGDGGGAATAQALSAVIGQLADRIAVDLVATAGPVAAKP
jgi:uncharacterized lipoprotein YmbA